MKLQSAAEFFRLAKSVRTKFSADGYLVIDGDREAALKASEVGHDAVQQLCTGLAAIGTLIATIDHDDKGYDIENLEDVGWLVTNMADLAYAMHERCGDIHTALYEGPEAPGDIAPEVPAKARKRKPT